MIRLIGLAVWIAATVEPASLIFAQPEAQATQVAVEPEGAATEGLKSSLGISKLRPASGRFVKVTHGFMVAYEQRLPSSQTSIRMQPIPAGKLVIPAEVAGGQSVTLQIQPMWMAEHEVSWGQYAHFMSLYRGIQEIATAGGDLGSDSIDAVSAPTELYDPSIHIPFAKSPTQPAMGMTQFGGRQFTKWLSLRSGVEYRLPGEDEWTYACIGGDSKMLVEPIAREDLQRIACFDNLPNGAALPGSFAANSFGLYEMLGNAAEWVITQQGHGITANWPPVQKQLLDAKKRYRQLACGGSWMDFPADCQPLSRVICNDDWWEDDPHLPLSPFWHAHGEFSTTIGFRICRSYKPLGREQIEAYWGPSSEQLRSDDDLRNADGRGARAVITDEIQEAASENPIQLDRYWRRRK